MNFGPCQLARNVSRLVDGDVYRIIEGRVRASLEFADVKGMPSTPQVLAYIHRLVGWELDCLREEGLLDDVGARWKYELEVGPNHELRVTFIPPVRVPVTI